jgi:hypothetical protein
MTLWLLEFAGERAIRLGEPQEWCPACLDMLELLWGEDIEVVTEGERWAGIYLARQWGRVLNACGEPCGLPETVPSDMEMLFGKFGARREPRARKSSVARAYLDIQAVVNPGQGERAKDDD